MTPSQRLRQLTVFAHTGLVVFWPGGTIWCVQLTVFAHTGLVVFWLLPDRQAVTPATVIKTIPIIAAIHITGNTQSARVIA